MSQSCHTTVAVGLLSLAVLLAPSADALRILGLFPHPGHSHFFFFHPIMRELAMQGHNVTVVSHFPDKEPVPNYRDLKLTGMPVLENFIDLDVFGNNNKYIGHFLEFYLLYSYGVTACETTYNSSAIREVLASPDRYDLIIMEQFNTDCMMGLAWKLQAPVIGLSSCVLMPWHYDRMGAPHTPSYLPALFMGLSDEMNFGQRLANWFAVNGMVFLKKHISDPAADRISRKYLGADVPPTSELVKSTSAMFVNQHYSLSGVKPLPASVIELGGIHLAAAKPLEASLQKYLDQSEHGVVYVSWGSLIRSETLSPEKREGLLQAFGQLKQNVIWKWGNDTLPNQPANVLIQKWMPQRDILCHPNVKVFVSHGGLMGTTESIHCGVPVVITPMFGDQFLNAAALSARGIGRVVHYADLTAESMADAIRFALEPQTQEKARKVQHSFNNRQNTPLQTAVWWAEHVAATGGVPLAKSHAVYMGAFEYYSFDVYALFLVVAVAIAGSWVWLVRRWLAKRKALGSKNKLKTK